VITRHPPTAVASDGRLTRAPFTTMAEQPPPSRLSASTVAASVIAFSGRGLVGLRVVTTSARMGVLGAASACSHGGGETGDPGAPAAVLENQRRA
jgi:hypothetical protein